MRLPDHLLREWLQHVRDFDVAHFDDVTVRVSVEAPHLSCEKVAQILGSIEPPFAHTTTIRQPQ
jgi:hypothetical protein